MYQKLVRLWNTNLVFSGHPALRLITASLSRLRCHADCWWVSLNGFTIPWTDFSFFCVLYQSINSVYQTGIRANSFCRLVCSSFDINSETHKTQNHVHDQVPYAPEFCSHVGKDCLKYCMFTIESTGRIWLNAVNAETTIRISKACWKYIHCTPGLSA